MKGIKGHTRAVLGFFGSLPTQDVLLTVRRTLLVNGLSFIRPVREAISLAISPVISIVTESHEPPSTCRLIPERRNLFRNLWSFFRALKKDPAILGIQNLGFLNEVPTTLVTTFLLGYPT